MRRVFISYRREDATVYAGRIHDRLTTHLGAANSSCVARRFARPRLLAEGGET